MTERNRLQTITDANWAPLRDAPATVLLLARDGCPPCEEWSRELQEFLAQDTDWTHVQFGKLMLDGDEVELFKAANADWLEVIPGVPFHALFRDGQPITSLAGGGVERLLRRLQSRFGDMDRDED